MMRAWRRLWLASLLACAAAPALADESAASAEQDPFVAAVARMRRSVVAVGAYHSNDTPTIQYYGTGFVIHDGRTIVTNAHVVEAIRRIKALDKLRVFFPDDGAKYGRPAAVFAEDRFHDVLLLRFEGPAVTPLELNLDQVPRQGQSVGVLGYPIGLQLGLVPAVHRGVIAAVVPAVLPLPRGAKLTPELADAIRRPYHLYQLDMVVYPGNSGSPVFGARDGRVLGIINKTLATRTREHLLQRPSGIAYAVPNRWIHELLQQALAASRRQLDPSSVPDVPEGDSSS